MQCYSFNIPFSKKCIKNCGESIQWLLKMREHLLELHSLVIKHTSNKSSNDTSLNRREPQKINPKSSYMRDTYYTPPKEKASRLPLFMSGPPSIYDKNVVTVTSTTINQTNSNNAPDELSFKGDPDVYGYRALLGGRYYNIFTKSIYKTHPLENKPAV